MSRIRLLSTDFDGTLIAHPSDGKCVPEFAEVLTSLKSDGGIWAVNTGRSLAHAIEGIALFDAPVRPDFLLTNEREIFAWEKGEWVGHAEWNSTCYQRHDELFEVITPILDSVRRHTDASKHVTLIHEDGRPVGVVTTTEEAMDDFTAFLEAEARGFSDFSYQRNTVYLRFCHRDYHKGSSLGELAAVLKFDRSEVCAAGDHFNDLPMLDGTYSAYSCCPSNAIPEVKAVVAQVGGYVASQPAGRGIAEAWHAFQ